MRRRAVSLWPGAAAAVLLAVLCSNRAEAVDGVIEINQTAVLAGGITPGDTPGFPVTLSQPGSYRLTGNLDVRGQPTPENVGAILIASDNVTVDLNGFSILGPCTGGPPCAPTGSGTGVFTNGEYRVATVKNGAIRGMGQNGLNFNADPSFVIAARIEGVTVDSNGGSGMTLAADSIVKDCIARGNGSHGFSTGFGGTGITFSGNVSSRNGGDGIQGGLGTIFVIGNHAQGNTGWGLEIFVGGYVNNALVGNGSGSVNGSGENLGQNLCNTMLCP